MKTRQVSFQALKYLLSDVDSIEDLQGRDLEELVKFTLTKMGMPPSTVSDEDLWDIQEELEEGLKKYLESRKPKRESPKQSSLSREPWFREASPQGQKRS